MSSISSQFISQITLFRNPNGPEEVWTRTFPPEAANPLKVVLAEVGYIVTIPFAIIETALSVVTKVFSSCLPTSRERHEAMSRWVESSAFSVAWSFCNAVINVCFNDMIVNEKVAKACAKSGNFFRVPVAALPTNTPGAIRI